MAADVTHLTSLFENATEGIVLTDGQGRIALVNPAAERLFGYQSSELFGQPVEILIPERFKGNHRNLREGFYDKPSNRIMGHGRDLYGRTKSGTDVPLEVSLSYYKKDGELFVIAFIVDISARKKAEEDMLKQKKELERISSEVKQLNTELEAKVEERTQILKEALGKLEQSQIELNDALDKERELNEIKSRFVSMASHEFRTPLSAVLSSASLLSKYVQSEDQPRRDKHITRIKESVRHLNTILEDFLSLGKLNEQKVTVSFATFDFQELVNDVMEEMKSTLRPGQKIQFMHKGNRIVTSDKNLLRNVLLNLLSNASKFSAEEKNVYIESEVENGGYSLTVRDEGVGIPAADLDRLFQSFFRASNATNIQGTGLGLHIVKRYINLLGGQIKLKTKLNEGTNVIITVKKQNLLNEDHSRNR